MTLIQRWRCRSGEADMNMNNLADEIGKWLLRVLSVWLIGGIVCAIAWSGSLVFGLIIGPIILFGIWIFVISFDE